MLTTRQYEGIGRLTIAFNEIDEVMKAYLPLIVQHSKCAPAPSHRGQSTFHTRELALRETLVAASAADELAGAYASVILKILDNAAGIAKKRNEFVHAVAFIDFTTNTKMLQLRSGDVIPNEQEFFDLANEAVFVASKLAEECEAMLRLYLGMDGAFAEFKIPEGFNDDESVDEFSRL
jgi:hypothetical protein